MDYEELFKYVRAMITSSSNTPKHMSISTVKVADILGVAPSEIEQGLKELVIAGRLQKSKLPEPPNYEVYLLP